MVIISHVILSLVTFHVPMVFDGVRLGDEGGQVIVKNMIKNKTLRTLNVASNDITEATAPALSEVIYSISLLFKICTFMITPCDFI